MEQRVPRLGQSRGHDGALVGFEAGPQPPPTLGVVPARHPAGIRLRLHGIAGLLGVELVAGQAAPQLGHGGQAGQVGRLGLAVGGDVAGHDARLDRRPARRPRRRPWWRAAHLGGRPAPPRLGPGRGTGRSSRPPTDRRSRSRRPPSSATPTPPPPGRPGGHGPAFSWPHTSPRAASISATSIRTSVRTGVLQSFPLIGATAP